MSRYISINEAREELPRLVDELAQSHETVTVIRRDEPVLVILPWELYEGIIETVDVMGDADLMVALHQGIQDAITGRALSLDELEATFAR